MRATGEMMAELEEHRALLWKLLYRMTGSAADADDLVQETFAKAVERPPEDLGMPIRPWLVRVAMNLGRDLLRQRRRRGYVGPWLPSPIEISEEPELEAPDRHYDLAESATFAFLLALEALTPSQRAVLLLRDVFDYSVEEAARALESSEGAVKTLHHRARQAMARYDGERSIPSREMRRRTQDVLEALFGAVAAGNSEAVHELLATDARALSDGGGEVLAALRPIRGRDKVARFLLKLNAKYGPAHAVEWRQLNGMPALVLHSAQKNPRLARRLVVRGDLDADGRVRELHIVLAGTKLRGLSGA